MSIQETKNERYVQLGEVPEAEAKKILVASSATGFEGVSDAVPTFQRAEYRSFNAEYTMIDGSLIIHFFLPTHAKADTFDRQPLDVRERWMAYWLQRFPVHLDAVARKYFEAEAPRLKAKYTEEVASWWFKADNYSHLLSVDQFVSGFFAQLDASLQRPDGSS